MERGTTKAILILAFLVFFLIALKFDALLEFLRATEPLKLAIIILVLGAIPTFFPVLLKRLLIWLAGGEGKRKPLSEKKCREIVLKYVKENVLSHGYVGRSLNIVAQRLDGTDFDCPFGWFAVTTRQFPGTRKIRMDEVSHNELFVCYINRLNGDISYEPAINQEIEADTLLKDLRMHGLPFDKVRKVTEIEKLVAEQEAVGYGTERGREIAQKGKPMTEKAEAKK